MKLPSALFDTPAMPLEDIVVWTRDPEVAARVLVRRRHGTNGDRVGYCMVGGKRTYWVLHAHFNDVDLYEGAHVADAARVPVMPVTKPQAAPKPTRQELRASAAATVDSYADWFRNLMQGPASTSPIPE